MMRPRFASVVMPKLKIQAPLICRRAWARFLASQGATDEEISSALGIPRQHANRLMQRRDA